MNGSRDPNSNADLSRSRQQLAGPLAANNSRGHPDSEADHLPCDESITNARNSSSPTRERQSKHVKQRRKTEKKGGTVTKAFIYSALPCNAFPLSAARARYTSRHFVPFRGQEIRKRTDGRCEGGRKMHRHRQRAIFGPRHRPLCLHDRLLSCSAKHFRVLANGVCCNGPISRWTASTLLLRRMRRWERVPSR